MSDFEPNQTEAADSGEEVEQSPFLSPIEARVLGVLMEKQLTVPDTYPLTLNSLTLGCNQKSNREPQMNLSEGEVGHTAKMLEERNLTRIEYGERAHRIEHKMRSHLSISKQQLAILSVLLLRGPQTVNELKVRTQRSLNIDDLDEIKGLVESLIATNDPTIATHVPHGAGQREDRYGHLLCGEVEFEPQSRTSTSNKASPVFTPPPDQFSELVARVEALEARLANLEEQGSS